MELSRFQDITAQYPKLRIALVGDFCLDRYLEIDPARAETSLETRLPVHNVVRVRSQPGAAGTILNNLVALGVGCIYPVGFCGVDGEGFELQRALQKLPGVNLEAFVETPERATFTYCKPLVISPGGVPVELNRFDTKNWTATPLGVQAQLAGAIGSLAGRVDAIILLDQVDVVDTGVVTSYLLETVRTIARARPQLLIMADSRSGLGRFPPVCLKMNRSELAALTGAGISTSVDEVRYAAAALARKKRKPVFVTLAEEGIVGATPDGTVEHVPALPPRGPIDIVGAGDAVTANLATALASGATMAEAVTLANAGASVVIHQLGTTGTASVEQIKERLRDPSKSHC